MNPYLTSHLSADYSDSHLKTDASVYVQAGWLQPNNEFLGETTWVHSESVKSGGWMGRGIVGRVDMLEEDGGSVERQLWEHLGASPNFRGIRYMVGKRAPKREGLALSLIYSSIFALTLATYRDSIPPSVS